MERGRDFFGFCTALKPLERKALGTLSEVRHLEEGETVYSPGDPADLLYIINRGVVEVAQDNGNQQGTVTYLSRGDVFGDVEALSGLPAGISFESVKRQVSSVFGAGIFRN